MNQSKMLNKLFAVMLIFGLFVFAGAEVEACDYEAEEIIIIEVIGL